MVSMVFQHGLEKQPKERGSTILSALRRVSRSWRSWYTTRLVLPKEVRKRLGIERKGNRSVIDSLFCSYKEELASFLKAVKGAAS